FANVVIHARVVDEKGKKMSKSKGNVIDPLVLIDQFGADALRFTMAIAAGPGRDIRMSDKRVEGYRNFRTKLWNAARFCQMNECFNWEAFDPVGVKGVVNRWIVSETAQAARAVDAALAGHRFDEAAQALYSFIWNVFCDWYVELIKPVLSGADESAKTETRQTAAWVLDQILKILHPFMPFVTEELWDKLAEFGPKRANMLIVEAWPDLPESLIDGEAAAEIQWLIDLVSGIRSLKSEANVPGSAKITALLVNADPVTSARLERYQNEIDRLARLDYSNTADAVPKGSLTFVLDGTTVALPMEGIIDIGAEKARLAREIARCTKDIAGIEAKLGNPKFVERAPPEIVEENQERLAALGVEKSALEGALARLGEG
ncbi:MAG: class I tRNA ligase family protein, partial [Hyphomonadaceae bacterium]|nr:class I tRNA ligase family protein [Hyphomonadaceae bacterium]